jgi:hypothetical protein
MSDSIKKRKEKNESKENRVLSDLKSGDSSVVREALRKVLGGLQISTIEADTFVSDDLVGCNHGKGEKFNSKDILVICQLLELLSSSDDEVVLEAIKAIKSIAAHGNQTHSKELLTQALQKKSII